MIVRIYLHNRGRKIYSMIIMSDPGSLKITIANNQRSFLLDLEYSYHIHKILNKTRVK